jgi:hypothetical protein
MNQPGCWLRLESEWARKRCGSCPPSSAADREAAEERPPARTRAGPARVWGAGPPRSALGCAIRLATEPGLNPGELHGLGRSTRSASADRLYPTGEGACLISRYRVVRLHGGGLAGSSVVRAPILYIGNQSPVRSRPGRRRSRPTGRALGFYPRVKGFETSGRHASAPGRHTSTARRHTSTAGRHTSVAGAIGQRGSLLRKWLRVRVPGGALLLRWRNGITHLALIQETAGSSPARSTAPSSIG